MGSLEATRRVSRENARDASDCGTLRSACIRARMPLSAVIAAAERAAAPALANDRGTLSPAALAAPPIFTNTVAGVQSVPPSTVEAARGMGLTEFGVLIDIEVPMAIPLIMEGVRIAFVQVIATATLGAIVAWGGLGRYIIDGFAVQDNGEILFGALAVGLLAVLAEVGFSAIQRNITPRGLRTQR
jgi:ABC-type proline/glycine betaine transport system permease subunit